MTISVAGAVDITSVISLVVGMLAVVAGLVVVPFSLVVIFVDAPGSPVLKVVSRVIVVTALASAVLMSVVCCLG